MKKCVKDWKGWRIKGSRCGICTRKNGGRVTVSQKKYLAPITNLSDHFYPMVTARLVWGKRSINSQLAKAQGTTIVGRKQMKLRNNAAIKTSTSP